MPCTFSFDCKRLLYNGCCSCRCQGCCCWCCGWILISTVQTTKILRIQKTISGLVIFFGLVIKWGWSRAGTSVIWSSVLAVWECIVPGLVSLGNMARIWVDVVVVVVVNHRCCCCWLDLALTPTSSSVCCWPLPQQWMRSSLTVRHCWPLVCVTLCKRWRGPWSELVSLSLSLALSLSRIIMQSIANWITNYSVNLLRIWMICDVTMWLTVGDSVVTSMWGEKAGVPLHSIHFGFTLGSLVGPFIVSSFIPDETEPHTEQELNSTIHWSSSTESPLNVTQHGSGTTMEHYETDNSTIEYAYIICSVCTVCIAFVFFIMEFIHFPVENNNDVKKKSHSWQEIFNPKYWAMGNLALGILTITLLNLFYIFHLGAVKGPSMLLTTYAVDSDLDFSQSEAAALTAATGLGGAISRGLMIFVAGFISVEKILLITVHGQLISAILLLFFGTQSKRNLWICSFIFGFMVRPIWASGYQWGNEYIIMVAFIFAMTRMVSKLCDVGQNALQGYLYSNVDIDSLFCSSVIYSILHCLLLYCMLCMGRAYGTRYNRNKETKSVPEDSKQRKTL